MDPGVAHPQWIHLTARLSSSAPSLCVFEIGQWLWSSFRRAFPSAIAATLMPDHPHVLVRTAEPEDARLRVARVFGQMGRRFGLEWPVTQSVSFSVIGSGLELERHVRYIALNPCRAELVRCPLAFPWTTHRDVVGAIVDPWVTADRLAATLRRPASGFAERHHAYVSGDPDASVEGTPMPAPAPTTAMAIHPLRRIAEAASTALRRPLTEIRQRGPVRALFVALAVDQGWSDLGRLAELCECTRAAIRELSRKPDAGALRASRLCLGDARFRTEHERRFDRDELPARFETTYDDGSVRRPRR